MTAILFDLGGTHLRAAVEFNCSQVSVTSLAHRRRYQILNFVNGGSAETIWLSLLDMICGYVAEIAGMVPAQTPVILGFPGPIGPDGTVVAAPTIVGNGEICPDFGAIIAERTQRPVYLLNEMSAAAWWMSAHTTASRFLIVTVSSGVGSKVFARDSTFGVIDNLPFAGEIGHLIVDHSEDAPQCDCGGKGHLGAIASGRGIERFARKHARHDPSSFSESLCAIKFSATPGTLSNEAHLVPAARLGDEWACNAIARCTAPLAQVIATVTVAVGLDRVAVIGGLAQSLGDTYRRILEDQLAPYGFFQSFPDFGTDFIEVHPPEDEVCLLGAATYASRRLELT